MSLTKYSPSLSGALVSTCFCSLFSIKTWLISHSTTKKCQNGEKFQKKPKQRPLNDKKKPKRLNVCKPAYKLNNSKPRSPKLFFFFIYFLNSIFFYYLIIYFVSAKIRATGHVRMTTCVCAAKPRPLLKVCLLTW